MRRPLETIWLTALLAAGLALPAPPAAAHESYNLYGYGPGLAGSLNGADGQPAAVPPATWTDGGVPTYSGGLPVMWYAGMHHSDEVRVIQTGVAPNPPAGSMLAGVIAHNAVHDPDLPTDRVLAVGGKSWSDPANGGNGWGHGLDYGLIELHPLDHVLEDGPVTVTVTVADDPTDAVSPRLAFALYTGWDTNPGSTRHQTFFTQPAPGNDPLGSTGLTLLGYAVASDFGKPASLSFAITDDSAPSKYTILVGALGGVAGQYQLAVSVAPNTALGQCLADADGDGVGDGGDACPATPASTEVDSRGCSRAQFCNAIAVADKIGARTCKRADWKNDEPLMTKKTADCLVDKPTASCKPTTIP